MPEKDMTAVAVPETWKEKQPDTQTRIPAFQGPEQPSVVERKHRFGDSVCYVDNSDERHRVLDAVVMDVFADQDAVNLRVFDPENQWLHFDAVQVERDDSREPGTYHYSNS